ncbi:DUF3147 family protein [Clostridium sp. Marseille-Q7071]
MQFILKTLISSLLIAIVSTISKKSPFVGAIIISLPITSILALIWLYSDTKDINQVISLSSSICFMILPSILFFIVLAILLKHDFSFIKSIIFSSIAMITFYTAYSYILNKVGINL